MIRRPQQSDSGSGAPTAEDAATATGDSDAATSPLERALPESVAAIEDWFGTVTGWFEGRPLVAHVVRA